MHGLVLQQHGTACKTLAALTAWEGAWVLGHTGRRGRPSSGAWRVAVDAPVLQQVGALPEALATVSAVEGLLARVHAPVFLQACTAHEALAAVTADEWPLLSVRELVA